MNTKVVATLLAIQDEERAVDVIFDIDMSKCSILEIVTVCAKLETEGRRAWSVMRERMAAAGIEEGKLLMADLRREALLDALRDTSVSVSSKITTRKPEDGGRLG